MKLTKEDWAEIYNAVDTKLGRVRAGDYGEDEQAEEWADHLLSIEHKIGDDGQEACNAYEELVEAARELCISMRGSYSPEAMRLEQLVSQVE